MKSFSSALLLYFILLWDFSTAERSFVIKLTKVEHRSLNPEIGFISGSNVETVDNLSYLNINFTVGNVTGKIIVSWNLSLVKGNKYLPMFRNITGELCDVFQRPNRLPSTLKSIYDEFFKSCDFPPRCPLQKGSYYLKRFHLDEDAFPPHVPRANVRYEMRLFQLTRKIRTDLTVVAVTGRIQSKELRFGLL